MDINQLESSQAYPSSYGFPKHQSEYYIIEDEEQEKEIPTPEEYLQKIILQLDDIDNQIAEINSELRKCVKL